MKMEEVLISVIIPLYNKAPWVEQCIRSVIGQTYQNIEILVINDGSTDKSREVVAVIDDPRIKIFDKPNGGVSSARNLGIEKAMGKYVAFIDADDEWMPKHLEVLIEGFNRFKEVVLVCDDYIELCFDEQNHASRRRLPFSINIEKIQYHIIENYLETLRNGYFLLSGSSVLLKLSVIKEHKISFSEQLTVGEDINYWLQLLSFGRFVFCDYIGLKYYRVDEQSAMNRNGKMSGLTPQFFQGIDIKMYNKKEQKYIKDFITQEYYKKAFQNRGLPFRLEELKTIVGGGVKINILNIFPYIGIRYCPQFIFSIYKTIKERK